MSGYALKLFSGLSKTRIRVHNQEVIPDGSVIFTANHFTRIETIFLPYHLHNLTKKPVLSLAAADLFVGGLNAVLRAMGALSTKDPDRDELFVKNLISGNASWIIFPEGMMVKNKKLVNHFDFQLTDDRETHRPHTGAAAVALRSEFYRERLRRMKDRNPEEFKRLIERFGISDPEKTMQITTHIVPVNITYYPIRARDNFLSTLVENFIQDPSPRMMDELMTEGTMVLSGVDVDIRFGDPIQVSPFFNNSFVESDLTSRRRVEFGRTMSSHPIMRQAAVDIMEQYMASVYSMTTLNYDHLFACILNYLPDAPDGIAVYDFRCRAFLAVSSGRLLDSGAFLHQLLSENQIHLLTDDRFNRISEFLESAAATGVIRITDGFILKNQIRFDSLSGFHEIRIENPVAVMANEVEPLTEIQPILRNIAVKDTASVYQLVQLNLLDKISREYADDYEKYHIPGESKPKSVGEPFLLQSEVNLAGVLLIHGYMASPEEMRPFAEFLNNQGYTVYVPRLKGHGTSPENLAETRFEDWIASVEEGYVVLKHTCSSIFVGGFSTGAGLALDLMTRVDDVHAVFAVAPPMKLMDFGSRFVPAIDMWNHMVKRANLGKISKEFVKNSPENPHINYVRNPVAGVRQLEKFMETVEAKLSQIEVPVLVVQSRNDPVVDPSGTQKLFEKLGSHQKEYFLFDIERHGILLGNGVKRVYRAIGDFLTDELRKLEQGTGQEE